MHLIPKSKPTKKRRLLKNSIQLFIEIMENIKSNPLNLEMNLR